MVVKHWWRSFKRRWGLEAHGRGGHHRGRRPLWDFEDEAPKRLGARDPKDGRSCRNSRFRLFDMGLSSKNFFLAFYSTENPLTSTTTFVREVDHEQQASAPPPLDSAIQGRSLWFRPISALQLIQRGTVVPIQSIIHRLTFG